MGVALPHSIFSPISVKPCRTGPTCDVSGRRSYIAGAINFAGDECLFGRNWGCIEHRPFLHFEICYYQAIEFAIEHGLKRVEAGAQGEHNWRGGTRRVDLQRARLLTQGLKRLRDHR